MRKRLRLFLGAILMVAAGVIPPSGSAAAETNGGVRVMPLGDSITDGTQVPGGYRIGLWQRLAAGGFRTDLVGSLVNGPTSLGDHDHEGHSGWRIDQIDANIAGWLHTTSPHAVLLHIGTNDVLQNFNLGGAPGRLSTLVDRITAAVPNAEVFVATIIPLTNAGQEANVRSYNATIPGMVRSKANAGRHVHLVDLHSAVTTADLIDGIHPTATGYNKMAAAWFAALQSVPGSLGDPGRPITGAQSGRCVDVTGITTTNGTQVQLWDCNRQTNQAWTRTPGRQLMVYGTRCLDASGHGTTNGTPVIIWDCNGQPNQQWNVNANGTITGVQSGLCLDAAGPGTANGTKVQLWGCTGAANQQWTLG
ncbi:MAG TPA: ricin-type beta-trefoil lectin domain protein [Actinophytocola sp.]|uniref:ricin-type beta-trefoil lectin domain protein n=1 Tax=Actinophytocola sp. TaxID=1872138 RepID=UPI002DC04805|nr:ricin-type beta-trefoil lectin domain protein [Actinophytocola sp.]HEU5473674.1 ricin-type beta-trefoil lectin domain protein [Actinophytocola sp.]